MPRTRLILLTLSSLLLGALTTIALAWLFACSDPSTLDKGLASDQVIRPQRGPVSRTYMGGPPDGIGATLYSGDHRIVAWTWCFGPNYQTPFGSVGMDLPLDSPKPPDELVPAGIRSLSLPWLHDYPWPRGGDVDWREIQASGWPLISMASEFRRAANFGQERRFGIPYPVKPAPTYFRLPRAGRTLPLLPLFPGFLLDTLLFSALWLPLLLLPRSLRRALRRRRNQCPKCAYDLRATPPNSPCPECGHTQNR